jgi:hypothetical protein
MKNNLRIKPQGKRKHHQPGQLPALTGTFSELHSLPGTGTVIPTSAAKLMDILETQYGGTLTYTRAWALEREPWIT